ncbi:MAG: carboxymuconolactone decarboxylase family protein [Nitrososphaerota archaeon]|nr:carboxymuconolactone decarboxylase family protein [Nitrososphaerota archaeon]
MDEPFLHPIDEPSDPAIREAYQNMKQYFGKVMTPARVFNSRMPPDFLQFYTQISVLDQELELSKETVMLIRQQVARINVCLFCIDSNRAATIWASMNQAKFDTLDRYQTSPLFSEAERAALDYVTTLTKERKVDPKVFAKLLKHYSERQICEIVYLVASEHVYNMTNIGLNIHSDMLCNIARKRVEGTGKW